MGILDILRSGKAKHSRIAIPVERVGASRGVFQGKHIPPIVEFQIDTEDGDKLTLEMTPEQCKEAIEAMTYTYYAIHPPIKNRNYGGFTL